MIKEFIIAFLLLTVTCSAQEGTKGTIKVKKTESEISAPLTIVEQMPVFPGGDNEMMKFIQKNIKYPQEEKEEGIQGTVYVTFVVDADGTLLDVKTLRGVSGGSGCDVEALRVVKMMPKWIAGKQNGRAVAVQVNLPIKCTL